MSERTVLTCDKCNNEISLVEKFVNFGEYGIHLHDSCWHGMDAVELTAMLDLSGKYMKHGDWQNADKIARHAREQVKIKPTFTYGKIGTGSACTVNHIHGHNCNGYGSTS